MYSGKLFSERQKELRGEAPDVYQYDMIPRELRVQVVHIWQDAFGIHDPDLLALNSPQITKAYELIHEALCYRYGEFSLGDSND